MTEGTASAIVRVTGLSTRELGALSGVAPDAVAWHDVLRVTVTGADVPIVGRYSVRPTSLEFRPMFPFDAGRSYSVRFDGGRLPDPRRPPITETVLVVPAEAAAPPAAVTRVDPALDRWPENLLRFYIHFSAPMSRQSGVGLVHVLDERGEEVTDALLPVEVDFWNDDHTRLTVFFEPGRVKRGILPNRQMGRALQAGRRVHDPRRCRLARCPRPGAPRAVSPCIHRRAAHRAAARHRDVAHPASACRHAGSARRRRAACAGPRAVRTRAGRDGCWPRVDCRHGDRRRWRQGVEVRAARRLAAPAATS